MDSVDSVNISNPAVNTPIAPEATLLEEIDMVAEVAPPPAIDAPAVTPSIDFATLDPFSLSRAAAHNPPTTSIFESVKEVIEPSPQAMILCRPPDAENVYLCERPATNVCPTNMETCTAVETCKLSVEVNM